MPRVLASRAVVVAVAAALAVARAAGQNLPLPPLPYAYDALEPLIDEATMKLHHLGHHQAYTTKLNAALSELRADPDHKHLAKLGVDKLLKSLDDVPPKLRGTVRNNGGGYVNHEVFWNSMRPATESNAPEARSAIEQEIIKAFGSVEAWKTVFTEAALGVFGSGWAWLTFDGAKVAIVTTPNQDTPEHPPLLGLDVWEHAYYLKYQNRRTEYVEGWFKLIDWAQAEARLLSLRNGAAKDEL